MVPAGAGSGGSIPASRIDRATPVTTPKNTPLLPPVALVSLTKPSVPELTVIEATETRMPSRRSNWSKVPAGSGKVVVSAIGIGSGLPLDSTRVVAKPSSVSGGWKGSDPGVNSVTVPCTCTSSPTATIAPPGVNTKMPSEVSGSASMLASGSWMKKPLLFSPVTMPRVTTMLPFSGETAPLPWMSWIGVITKSSLRMVPSPCTSPAVAPTTLVILTKKFSSGSTVVSPITLIGIITLVLPMVMTCPTPLEDV